MRIIHVILGKVRLDRMNGVNKVVHQLALHQHQQGQATEIWGITSSPETNGPDRAYQVSLFQRGNGHFFLHKNLKKALRQLAGESVCLHLHGGFVPVFYRISRLLRRHRIPYVFCPHGTLSPGILAEASWKKRVYFRLFEASLVKHAQVVQLLGKRQYEQIGQLVQVRKKVLIPNGQNIEELIFQGTDLLKPWDLIFSYLGRIELERKGLDVLLAGFARYCGAGGRGSLWIIGDGPDLARLEAMSQELRISNRVRFWGSRFGTEKLNLLANSQLFVLTSRHEGLPTEVLEAAGLGLPCLLTTETNLAEEFSSHLAGIHLTINQPTNIAYALEKAESLWKTGELKEMGANAKHLVERTYNWDHIASQTIQMYQGDQLYPDKP